MFKNKILIITIFLFFCGVAFAAVSKLSQIATSGSSPALTDTLVGVASGTTDTQWTLSQVKSSVNAGEFVQLAQIVTSGSQATVDFTSISASYSSIKVVWSARDTASGTLGSAVYMKVNNDGTAGNYTNTTRTGAQATIAFSSEVTPTTGGMYIGGMPTAGDANFISGGEILLYNYAGTTFNKTMNGRNGYFNTTNGAIVQIVQSVWKSTSAINRVTFSTSGTAFVDGSTFTLYGMK